MRDFGGVSRGDGAGKKSPQRGLTTECTEDTTERQGRREEEQPEVGPKGEGAGATESKCTEEEDGAVLGQAKLALRFQIPLQSSLHKIVKLHRSLTSRAALLGSGTAEDLGMRTDCGPSGVSGRLNGARK